MTDTVEATITDLDAMLANGEHDTCAISSVSATLRLLRWEIKLRDRKGECGRRAVAVVSLLCPEHGTLARAICAEHLRILRRQRVRVTCPRCERRVVVKDHAS